MDNMANILGVLGAYFAVLLVLAVAVETILEPITLFKGLQKKVSPEDYMKDIGDWLPDQSRGKADATAIANFVKEFDTGITDIKNRVTKIDKIAEEIAAAFELDTTKARQALAIRMTAIRNKYELDERKRITVLRVLAAVIGVLIAVVLRIDTFNLLAGLFPPQTQVFFVSPIAHIGGMALTGLAASAGSSFWHDQLGKVRALKKASQQTASEGGTG